TDDDVAVIYCDGRRVLEQDKNSIQNDGRPFGDRSKDLWNTLGIWLAALEGKQVTIEATEFWMVTNKALPDGIARQISNAKSERKIKGCITALEEAGQNPWKNVSEISKRVLRPESRDTLRRLLGKVTLVDGSDAMAGPTLRQKTIGYLQLPD